MHDDDAEWFGRAAADAVDRQLVRVRRLTDRYGRVARIAAMVVGVVLVGVGVLLLVFPGPGWATIFLGLAAFTVGAPRLRRPLLAAVEFGGRQVARVRRSPTLLAVLGAAALLVTAFIGWLMLT
jgi:hypothetical protein